MERLLVRVHNLAQRDESHLDVRSLLSVSTSLTHLLRSGRSVRRKRIIPCGTTAVGSDELSGPRRGGFGQA